MQAASTPSWGAFEYLHSSHQKKWRLRVTTDGEASRRYGLCGMVPRFLSHFSDETTPLYRSNGIAHIPNGFGGEAPVCTCIQFAPEFAVPNLVCGGEGRHGPQTNCIFPPRPVTVTSGKIKFLAVVRNESAHCLRFLVSNQSSAAVARPRRLTR